MSNRLANSHLTRLYYILALGLLFRFALVTYVIPYPERFIQADAIGYDRLAINLAAGRGFSAESNAPYPPDNFRTPGYPFTIALFYRFFDHRPEFVLYFQVIMGVCTILLVYFLGSKIANPKVGLIASALLTISPHSITYTALLWSDTEYTLFFTLSIYLTIFIFTDTKLKWILLGGTVSAIAVLIHPRSIYLPTIIALLLLIDMLRRQKPIKQTVIYVLTYLLVFNLTLLPWRLRNHIVFGVPNLTSAAGINMLDYGAALTESARTGENQWTIVERYHIEIDTMNSRSLNPAEFSEVAFQLGLKKILNDPLIYAKIHMIGMTKIFLPGTSQINTLITGENSIDTTMIYTLFSTTDWDDQNKIILDTIYRHSLFVWGYIGFEILYLTLVYFFSIFALIKRSNSTPWMWLTVIILFYLSMVPGPAGAPRFRVVMMPLLNVLAAYGIVSTNFISRKIKLIHKSF